MPGLGFAGHCHLTRGSFGERLPCCLQLADNYKTREASCPLAGATRAIKSTNSQTTPGKINTQILPS